MELRHLRYFVAVAESLNFRRAADALNVSQPPLSKQIRDLEYELGADLFIREKRSIFLTSEGKAFLKAAKDILKAAAKAKSLVQGIKQGVAGRLHINFMSSAAAGLLQSIVRDFKTLYPKVDIRLFQSTVTQIITDLNDGNIDIGFVRLPVSLPENLQSVTILREDYYIALPEDHRLTAKETVKPEDLADENLITFPRHTAPGSFDELIAIFHKRNISPRIVQEAAPEQLTIAGLVAAGVGVSIVPACMSNIKIPGLVHRPLLGGENKTGIAVLSPLKPDTVTANFLACLHKDISE